MSETTTSNEPPPRRDEEEVHLFVERMAMAFADVGFPRMAGRVLFTVMSADEPLTAAEIGERLGVSAAAVSGAVRYLTQFGMLVREPVKGSRRDHYRMPDNPWYEATITKTGLYKNFIEHGLTIEQLEGPDFLRIKKVQSLMQSGALDADLRWRTRREDLVDV